MPIRIDPMVNPPVEVAITVQDPGKMIPFYVHLLGCEPIGEAFGPDFHLWAMRLGGTAIKLMYWKFPLADRDRSDLGLGYQEIAIHVTNLDEFLAECRRAGGNVSVPRTTFPESLAKPGSFAYVLDPEGNRIELIDGDPFVPPTDAFLRGLPWSSPHDIWP